MIEGRWQVLGSGRNEEQAGYLRVVESRFGASWLAEDRNHPLQQLWHRGDGLSSNELVLFGNALKTVDQHTPDWANRHVSKIKVGTENNRRGSVAEILGVAMFSTRSQVVTPAQESQPGFDLIIDTRATTKVYVSVKSFGMSYHELEFRREAVRFEKEFQTALVSHKRTGLGLAVDSAEFPSSGNWTKLRHFVTNDLANLCNPPHVPRSVGQWTVVPFPIASQELYRHSDYPSYQVIAISPFHRNEQQNLLTKLDAIGTQIASAVPLASSGALRMAFVQMPQTSAIGDYVRWVDSYTRSDEAAALDILVLYRLSADDSMRLNHHLIVMCSSYAESQLVTTSGRAPLAASVFLGLLGRIPPPERLYIGQVPFDLSGRYNYQSGHLYPVIHYDPNSGTKTNLSMPHRGLRQHSVLIMGERELVLQGRFPADGLLKLLA